MHLEEIRVDDSFSLELPFHLFDGLLGRVGLLDRRERRRLRPETHIDLALVGSLSRTAAAVVLKFRVVGNRADFGVTTSVSRAGRRLDRL